jgi:hypothetical protein
MQWYRVGDIKKRELAILFSMKREIKLKKIVLLRLEKPYSKLFNLKI